MDNLNPKTADLLEIIHPIDIPDAIKDHSNDDITRKENSTESLGEMMELKRHGRKRKHGQLIKEDMLHDKLSHRPKKLYRLDSKTGHLTETTQPLLIDVATSPKHSSDDDDGRDKEISHQNLGEVMKAKRPQRKHKWGSSKKTNVMAPAKLMQNQLKLDVKSPDLMKAIHYNYALMGINADSSDALDDKENSTENIGEKMELKRQEPKRKRGRPSKRKPKSRQKKQKPNPIEPFKGVAKAAGKGGKIAQISKAMKKVTDKLANKKAAKPTKNVLNLVSRAAGNSFHSMTSQYSSAEDEEIVDYKRIDGKVRNRKKFNSMDPIDDQPLDSYGLPGGEYTDVDLDENDDLCGECGGMKRQ
jgi:hypothetical protein